MIDGSHTQVYKGVVLAKGAMMHDAMGFHTIFFKVINPKAVALWCEHGDEVASETTRPLGSGVRFPAGRGRIAG